MFDRTPEFADDPAPETEAQGSPAAPEPPAEAFPQGPARTAPADTIAGIDREIASCRACTLCRTRTRTVGGTGALRPLVLVVGEAPGREEDEQGLPFVGRAGKLLDDMLRAISLSRETNCFIANTIKCRPPDNRDPLPEEEAACFHFLERQIAALKPRAILASGRVALGRLVPASEGITRSHGQFFDYRGIPLMPVFHPSFLLRDPSQKAAAWGDLKKFRALLRELEPGYEQTWSAGR